MYNSNVNPVALHFVNNAIKTGATKFLEFGCWTGSLGSHVKANNSIEWIGVEQNEAAIAIAKNNLDIIKWNCNDGIINLKNQIYSAEVILLVDVLEHLYEPIAFLKELVALSNQDVSIIFVLPNVECHQIIEKLASNSFEYEDSGILDRTHRYFWTPRSFRDEIIRLSLRIKEGPSFLMNDDGKILYKNWQQTGKIIICKDGYNIQIEVDEARAISLCSYGYGYSLSK